MSGDQKQSYEDLVKENKELRALLEEAREVLTAIRTGSVDALVVEGPTGEQVYTLQGADYPYRVFVEHMNEGAVTVDADGTILYANRLFADLVGMPLEQAVGRELLRFVSPADRPQWNELIREANGEPSRRELALVSATGESIPVLLSARHLPVEPGRFYCCIVSDLRRQHLHEQLRQSEERFRYMFESAGVALFEEDWSAIRARFDRLRAEGVVDLRRYLDTRPEEVAAAIPLVKIRNANEYALHLFKAPSKEMLLESLEHIFTPETTEIFKEELIAFWEGRDMQDWAAPLQALDGEVLSVLFSLVRPKADPDWRCVLVAVTDLTAMRRTEAALRESEARHELLANSAELLLRSESPQAVVDVLCRKVMVVLDCQVFFNYLLDPSGERLHLNASAGIPEEEVPRLEWLEMGSAVCGCVARDGKRIVAEYIGEIEDVRTELVRSYGVQAYACHPLVAQDRLIGTLSFGTRTKTSFSLENLSLMKAVADQVAIAMQRKQSEEVLRETQQRLQNWNIELEQAVNAKTAELQQSHERLRALTSELNLAEQRERKRLATELHDHLQQMLIVGKLTIGQGKRSVRGVPAYETVLKKVDDILSEALTYSRTLVAELSPPVLRDHGLAASLKWLAEYMKNKHEYRVTVVVPEGEDLKLPEDQKLLLFQSARELLINSAKHSGTGGATITLDQRADRLCVTVQDEGKGFDLAAAGTLSCGMSSKFGLYSIEERMRALGGSFDIRTAPDRGTTATLVLPLGRSAEVSAMEGAGLRTSPAAKRKGRKTVQVLLVDDHEMIRQGLRAVLENYDDVAVIGEAVNGEEALTAVEKLRPHVVVMDINMPRMNGIEATGRIKQRYPGIVVIGLSVNRSEDNQEAMTQAGAERLLTKESAVEELHEAIREAVQFSGGPTPLKLF